MFGSGAGEGDSNGGCPFSRGEAHVSQSPLPNPHTLNQSLPLWSFLSMHSSSAYHWANQELTPVDPLLLILLTASATLLVSSLIKGLVSLWRMLQEKGFSACLQLFAISAVKMIPGVASRIRAEQEKMVEKVQKSMGSNRDGWRLVLPEKGLPQEELIHCLNNLLTHDKKWQGKCSGTVYIEGSSFGDRMQTSLDAYNMFAHTNPLHPDVFPSVVRMEAEVVAMTAQLLGGGRSLSPSLANGNAAHEEGDLGEGERGEVCGNITTGGTESILMAVKSARDYMRSHKGIKEPELIMAESAHAGYNKACEYFNVKLRIAPVRSDFRANVRAIKSLITRNTIMIVGSAPGFPHGVIDPIQELGALALKYGCCLHVDCCLGGFVLPFAKQLGYPIPPFDFRVPGVTSISVDTHKYGLAPKGTSVILYRNHDLRRCQYVAVTEWSGGMYVSPTVSGSRSGGLIAGAWAALVAQGRTGFMEGTVQLMEAARKLRVGVEGIPGMYVLGEPDMTIVAFGTKPEANDVYRVNDAMTAKGWTLNALQRPPSVHMCLTLQTVHTVDQFLTDIADCVQEVQKSPSAYQNGMAPVYGAAAKIPDRVAVKDFLVNLMESSF